MERPVRIPLVCIDCGHCKAFRYTGEDGMLKTRHECHFNGRFDKAVSPWDRCHHELTTIDE